MEKKLFTVILFLVIVIVAATVTITGNFLEEKKNSEKTGPFKVIRVVDGDTVVIDTNQKIRLSGINTPETGECYYEEAKKRLEELVMDKEVFLESDKTDTDKYGRLLRYIYLNNSSGMIMVNALMVQENYAKVYDKYSYDTKYYAQLKQIEKQANNTGVWICANYLENCSFVASKNSDMYHSANSSVAKRIKPENIVCFTSRKEAENAGYKPDS